MLVFKVVNCSDLLYSAVKHFTNVLCISRKATAAKGTSFSLRHSSEEHSAFVHVNGINVLILIAETEKTQVLWFKKMWQNKKQHFCVEVLCGALSTRTRVFLKLYLPFKKKNNKSLYTLLSTCNHICRLWCDVTGCLRGCEITSKRKDTRANQNPEGTLLEVAKQQQQQQPYVWTDNKVQYFHWKVQTSGILLRSANNVLLLQELRSHKQMLQTKGARQLKTFWFSCTHANSKGEFSKNCHPGRSFPKAPALVT